MTSQEFKGRAIPLIDDLKAICADCPNRFRLEFIPTPLTSELSNNGSYGRDRFR